jgi:hypothetical protein
MPIIDSAKSAFDHARRRGALGLFRLASSILRKGLSLYERRMISRVDLRVALSTARFLERLAGTLLLGSGRHPD